MKGDFTRLTFRKERHYDSVRQQQGRVQTDADWNEQADIVRHRVETETVDVVGRSGAPKENAGFLITPDSGDFIVGQGRYYVDGILCENDGETAYTAQDDLPISGDPGVPTDEGIYFAYLDVWRRHLTALDDVTIREVALGGADTATRTKTVWQVRLLRVGNLGESVGCENEPTEWHDATQVPTGMLAARSSPGSASDEPCIVPPSAAYRSLENRLYRVEIHKGGTLGSGSSDIPTFKWSRDNGSIVSTWESKDGDNLVVADKGRDAVQTFLSGGWVELADDTKDLLGDPGTMVQLVTVDGTVLTIDPVTAGSDPVELAEFPLNPKVRRWDSEGAETVEIPAENDGWIALEDGVEVKFADGTYRTGDYWLIPARTLSGDVEWPIDELSGEPSSELRHGIHHHYCRLAVLELDAGVWTRTDDCRDFFPPLSNICAEDVCFDPGVCQDEDPGWASVDTVQSAIEALCRVATGTDLREHNKYLHGSGVVCGLKVKCGDDRRHVNVEAGYALDCEGNGIHLKDGDQVSIVAIAKEKGLLDNNDPGDETAGSGDVLVSVYRSTGGEIAYDVRKEEPQSFWQAVLDGTLLKDFYQHCIANLFLFLKIKFLPFPATAVPPPESQRLAASIVNLLWQLINPTTGRYVFLSKTEHQILFDFYTSVREMLQSESFCGMFDSVHEFPDYPYPDPVGIETIFGLFRFHTRVRLHPGGRYVYSCGTGNAISVFDLTTRQMVYSLEFPSGSNLDVQDVAFSADGTEMYAVGFLSNSNDSVFSTAAIEIMTGEIQSHTWGAVTVVCDIKFPTLATSPSHPGLLYAIGKSRGIFEFDPSSIPLTPVANTSFNATGLLALSGDGNTVYAAENHLTPVGTETSTFTRVRSVNLNNYAAAPILFSVGGNDPQNDIAISGGVLTVSGDPFPRMLHMFQAATGIESLPQVNLVHNTLTRLALLPGSGQVLVVQMDQNRVVRVNTLTHTLDGSFRIPAQILPVDIVLKSDGSEFYVCNYISGTINVVDGPTVFASSPPSYTMEPPVSLGTYRDDILLAYGDILGKFLQYLKDCFCDKFLIDCPECEKDDAVHLGVVTIKNGEVYHVCNFSKRRYVKSVRTVEYWLSAVPVIPMIKYAFSKFCCKVF